MTKRIKLAPPAPRPTTQESLARMTLTDPADWVPVDTSTARYKAGYRWWNKATNQYARRITSE